MEWVLKLGTRNGWGDVEAIEVGRLERRVAVLAAEELGPTLAESKILFQEFARPFLQTQVEEFAACARVCGECLKLRRLRDPRTRKIQTLFGTITADAPRIVACPRERGRGFVDVSWSPMTELPPDGFVTPAAACWMYLISAVAEGMRRISYAGYRFPPEVIHQAIWLYLRFTLSFRDVEDLLAERGIAVSYETVRRWVNHFGPMIAAHLRKRRPKPHATWHLDEVYLKIDGRMVYLCRVVDAEGEVLDVLVQSKRNKYAALKLIRKLLKRPCHVADERARWACSCCNFKQP